jgi:hypothetical protein
VAYDSLITAITIDAIRHATKMAIVTSHTLGIR